MFITQFGILNFLRKLHDTVLSVSLNFNLFPREALLITGAESRSLNSWVTLNQYTSVVGNELLKDRMKSFLQHYIFKQYIMQ